MVILHPRLGFFSLALARKAAGPNQPVDPNRINVRARRKEHLVNLQSAYKKLAKLEILETPEADYRFRLLVPKKAMASALADMLLACDWTNVKATAAANREKVGDGFVHALSEVWASMHRIQPRD